VILAINHQPGTNIKRLQIVIAVTSVVLPSTKLLGLSVQILIESPLLTKNMSPTSGVGLETPCVRVCVCVCCFVLLNRYWGIVTVPGSIPYGSRPGVAGSSPSTLTTSLAIPVPSSSSSNGPTTVPLTTMGLCHGGSVSWAGSKFVRPHW